MVIDRRNFIAGAACGMLSMLAGSGEDVMAKKAASSTHAKVGLLKDKARAEAVPAAIDLLAVNPVQGKQVLLKPNFNTADPFPASTHNDTLRALIVKLWQMGAKYITIGERSGPPATASVIADKGIAALARELDVGLINFEELPDSDWVRVTPKASHWRNGFEVARPVLEAECVVSTCCLKTHAYGGVFTMSLKLAVGITHKRNMRELHGSRRDMRRMIAEINQVYSPSLILMDGLEVFVDGGPMRGVKKEAGVMLASADRIALDAVGLAVLKDLGANEEIMAQKIFAQEQLVRAGELKLGVSGPAGIELVGGDEVSRSYAGRLSAILQAEA